MLTTEDKEEIKRIIVETFAASGQPFIDSIVDVTARAIEVFGTREKALRWLKTPVRSLGDQTPLSLLNTTEGVAQVHDTLGRVEHGVW
jgi:putative toxin-antitoxin system antitoxin component (TIGR02293 family)